MSKLPLRSLLLKPAPRLPIEQIVMLYPRWYSNLTRDKFRRREPMLEQGVAIRDKSAVYSRLERPYLRAAFEVPIETRTAVYTDSYSLRRALRRLSYDAH